MIAKTLRSRWDRWTGPIRLHCYLAANFRGRIVTVAGSRRGGNHAVVNWLIAALESDRAGSQGPVQHLNNLPIGRRGRYHASALGRLRREGVGDLVINYEDVDLRHITDRTRLVNRPGPQFLVVRSLLNQIASRQAWRSHRDPATANAVMPIDEAWLVREAGNRLATPRGWTVLPFDEWLVDARLRSRTLAEIGLPDVPIPSETAHHGGGSSFTGVAAAPAPDALRERYHQIDWPPDLVRLLLERADRRLLTAAEVAFLEIQLG